MIEALQIFLFFFQKIVPRFHRHRCCCGHNDPQICAQNIPTIAQLLCRSPGVCVCVCVFFFVCLERSGLRGQQQRDQCRKCVWGRGGGEAGGGEGIPEAFGPQGTVVAMPAQKAAV